MSSSEILALIALLDDPDEGVYRHVRGKLLEQGTDILPLLREKQTGGVNCDVHADRLDEVVSGMMENRALEGLKNWAEAGSASVYEGVRWLESACEFGANPEAAESTFRAMRRDVWLELNEELTALEQIRVINHVLYSVYGLRSVGLAEQSGAHALPFKSMEDRAGGPLGLGVLYLMLAESLEIPVRAVAVSGLFFLAYLDPRWDGGSGEPPVWFYINPFHGGEILSPEDMSEIATGLEPDWKPEVLSPRGVCSRLGNFLAASCERNNLGATAERLSRLLKAHALEA